MSFHRLFAAIYLEACFATWIEELRLTFGGFACIAVWQEWMTRPLYYKTKWMTSMYARQLHDYWGPKDHWYD